MQDLPLHLSPQLSPLMKRSPSKQTYELTAVAVHSGTSPQPINYNYVPGLGPQRKRTQTKERSSSTVYILPSILLLLTCLLGFSTLYRAIDMEAVREGQLSPKESLMSPFTSTTTAQGREPQVVNTTTTSNTTTKKRRENDNTDKIIDYLALQAAITQFAADAMDDEDAYDGVPSVELDLDMPTSVY